VPQILDSSSPDGRRARCEFQGRITTPEGWRSLMGAPRIGRPSRRLRTFRTHGGTASEAWKELPELHHLGRPRPFRTRRTRVAREKPSSQVFKEFLRSLVHADSLCQARKFPNPSFEPQDRFRGDAQARFLAAREAESEKLPVLRLSHCTLRLIHLSLSFGRSVFQAAHARESSNSSRSLGKEGRA